LRRAATSSWPSTMASLHLMATAIPDYLVIRAMAATSSPTEVAAVIRADTLEVRPAAALAVGLEEVQAEAPAVDRAAAREAAARQLRRMSSRSDLGREKGLEPETA